MVEKKKRRRLVVLVFVAVVAAAVGRVATTSSAVALGVSGREFALFGSTAALITVFFMGTLFGQWFDELVRRAERRVRESPRPGYGIFHGVVRAMKDDAKGPLISGTRLERRKQPTSEWQLVHHDIKVPETFRLIFETGREVDVSPGRPLLEGFAVNASAPSHAKNGRATRNVVTRVADGDTVWITGWLEHTKPSGSGAYRSVEAKDRLVAVGREPMVISKELPAGRWRHRAQVHRRSAFLALGVLVLLHATLFLPFDRLLVSGSKGIYVLWTIPSTAMFIAPLGVLAVVLSWRELVRRCKLKWA